MSHASGSGHGDGHQHPHVHGASLARAGERYRRPLTIAFIIVGGYFFVEVIAAVWTGSLSLLSDAGHMLTDVIGLGMALAAIQLANRHTGRRGDALEQSSAMSRHTFGLYRLEILAAFVNALLLFGVSIWVLIESVRRLSAPHDVLDTPMLIVAVVGLAVNVVAFLLLRQGAAESLNVRAAYLEVVADMVGSIGVIAAGLMIRWFGWEWIDPLVAMLIGLWILPRTWRLGRQAVHILLQAAPERFDLEDFVQRLTAIDAVVDVHDVHVWTLTSDMNAASAHLVVADGTDTHRVLDQARDLAGDRFGIEHGTFQVEPVSHSGCDALTW